MYTVQGPVLTQGVSGTTSTSWHPHYFAQVQPTEGLQAEWSTALVKPSEHKATWVLQGSHVRPENKDMMIKATLSQRSK